MKAGWLALEAEGILLRDQALTGFAPCQQLALSLGQRLHVDNNFNHGGLEGCTSCIALSTRGPFSTSMALKARQLVALRA